MSLKKNVIANYLGQGWISLMGIAFIPVYIEYLGMESYGLIGVYSLLQAWLALLDLGMTPTLNREMARSLAGAHTEQSIADLFRTLEIVCCSVAVLIAGGLWWSSGWLASNWLRAERLPIETVAGAIGIMAFLAALKFIENLYRSALMGLQRQVWLNGAGSVLATLRWAGPVGILAWVSPTIEAFFLWQVAVAIVNVAVFKLFLNRVLPAPPQPATFSSVQLRSVANFAGGMMLQSLLVLLLMQVDKVVLSRLLTLEQFGYYTLAAAIAAALNNLIIPVTQAYYPRFSELVVKENVEDLKAAFHQGAQSVSVMLLPASLMLVFFSEPILRLWTGNHGLSSQVAPLLTLLASGTLLNGFIQIPYMLALAHGWSGFAVRVNTVAVCLLIPAILWVTPRYGSMGAAWIWVLLNCGYLLLAARYLFSRLLKSEMAHWYLHDLLRPSAVAVISALLLSSLGISFSSRWSEVGWLVIIGLILQTATAAAIPGLRDLLRRQAATIS